jgi:hypothetical protein
MLETPNIMGIQLMSGVGRKIRKEKKYLAA